jgi:hypothetical protein
MEIREGQPRVAPAVIGEFMDANTSLHPGRLEIGVSY